MNILLDENVDKRLANQFQVYNIKTVQQMGWAGKKNGELLKLMKDVFDVFITADQNLTSQQGKILTSEIAIIVLKARRNRLKDHLPLIPNIKQALLDIKKGQVICVQ
ncbi:MAG: DUF5615 family PIN-like protein [Chloroherpetonaceae bacterium]